MWNVFVTDNSVTKWYNIISYQQLYYENKLQNETLLDINVPRWHLTQNKAFEQTYAYKCIIR